MSAALLKNLLTAAGLNPSVADDLSELLPTAQRGDDGVYKIVTPDGSEYLMSGGGAAGVDLQADVLRVESQYRAVGVTGPGTVTVKDSDGQIGEIRVVGGTMGTVQVFDSLTGSGTAIVPSVTPAQGQVLVANARFNVGLTIVTGAATVLVVTLR